MKVANAFCHFCGAKFAEPLVYPRTCPSCGAQIWANPIPVAVALVPIETTRGTALLVIRRAIPPGVGKLALVGGFVEEHESWQVGCAREVREETGITIDAAAITPLWVASSEPKPNRVLIFGVAQALADATLPPFAPDHETSERGVIFGAGGLDEVFVFSLHAEAARRFFAARGIDCAHDFTPR